MFNWLRKTKVTGYAEIRFKKYTPAMSSEKNFRKFIKKVIPGIHKSQLNRYVRILKLDNGAGSWLGIPVTNKNEKLLRKMHNKKLASATFYMGAPGVDTGKHVMETYKEEY